VPLQEFTRADLLKSLQGLQTQLAKLGILPPEGQGELNTPEERLTLLGMAAVLTTVNPVKLLALAYRLGMSDERDRNAGSITAC
jgi:hypothetical protein